jgi:hypothetical protein
MRLGIELGGHKVRVTFVDASTGEIISESDAAPEQLPESFAPSTTLQFDGQEWQVEDAQPMTRREYAASRRLRLDLRKVERIDPTGIRFSTPTITNELPAMHPGDASASFVLYEDNWRQVELISSALEPAIEAEIGAIAAVRADSGGLGYATCHVRSHIPEPLDAVGLTIAELEAALGGADKKTLAIRADLVDDGFAFASGEGAVYGLARQGIVTVLGLEGNPDLGSLRNLASEHGLVLVDWVRARKFG